MLVEIHPLQTLLPGCINKVICVSNSALAYGKFPTCSWRALFGHTQIRLEQTWLKAFCAGTFTPGESVVARFAMIPKQGGTGGVGMSPS